MTADESGYDRRRVLKATGAALGVTGAVVGTGAATCQVVQYDAPAYDNCPPVDGQDGIIDAGTYVFAACAADDGTTYYYGEDADFAGYVPEAYVGPCD